MGPSSGSSICDAAGRSLSRRFKPIGLRSASGVLLGGGLMHLLEGKQVARRLKLNAGTLETLVQTGKVKDYAGKYDFDEVQRAIVEAQRATSTTVETTETTTEGPETHALGVARDLAEKAMTHEERMFAMYVKGLEQQNADNRASLKIVQDENAALRRQVNDQHETVCKLQQRYIESLEAHEAAISLAHERRLKEQELEAKNRRRDQGMVMLGQALPPLVASIQATLEQKNLIAQLFNTFEPGQLVAMTDPEVPFFKPEQRELIAKLAASVQKAKPSSQPSAPAASQKNGAEVAPPNGAAAPATEQAS